MLLIQGLNWLTYCWYKKQNSILADEMGLGKTVQSTAFLNLLFTQEKVNGPFLIVVPLSTMGNWEREIRTWTKMNLVTFHGNSISRNLIIETEFYYRDENGRPIPGIYKFDILLTTYEMTMSGASQLRPIPWRCAVLDEAHRLKNKASKVSEFLKSYSMEHRVLLTGTPLQNSLDELWALLNFLEPSTFPSEKSFMASYGNMQSATDVESLQGLLKPLMLRRLKEGNDHINVQMLRRLFQLKRKRLLKLSLRLSRRNGTALSWRKIFHGLSKVPRRTMFLI
jgi:chromodomain helicase DNA binding protein 8/chromodomain-helicase-DNA-binding protein 7